MNETLPAQRAFVFALRKMSLDVRVEVKGRGEELETDSALDDVRRFGQPRGVVQLDVSLEGVEVAEGLRAQVAVERLGGAVVVDVALQRLHGRKRFPAFVTHERVGTIDGTWKEGNVLFNNTFFYLWLYGRKDGNLLFNDALNIFFIYGYKEGRKCFI